MSSVEAFLALTENDMFEKSKALFELKKIQSALAKEIIEIETGNGAVKVKINGEQKIQKITRHLLQRVA